MSDPTSPRVIFGYTCPDCGQQFQSSQTHQHADGEWITGESLAAFSQAVRWSNFLRQQSAAAPDLIAALKALHAEVQKYNIGHEGSELLEIMSDAQSAIAKAEGKPL